LAFAVKNVDVAMAQKALKPDNAYMNFTRQQYFTLLNVLWACCLLLRYMANCRKGLPRKHGMVGEWTL
jgi:hypothetical protein